MIGLPMEALLAAQTAGTYGVTNVEIQHHMERDSYSFRFTYSIDNREYHSAFEVALSDIPNLTVEQFQTILDVHTKHNYNLVKANCIAKKGENT